MKNCLFLQRFKNRTAFAGIAVVLSFPFLNIPQASAFGGGSGSPFGNGEFFPNTGTFQASIRGANISGVAVFSTASGGSGGGSFTIYNGASTYIGNINSSISGTTLSVTMEASLPGIGTGSASTTVSSTFGLTGKTVVSGGTNTVSGGTNITRIITPDLVTTESGRTNSTSLSDITGPQTNTTVTGAQTDVVTTTGQTNVVSTIPVDNQTTTTTRTEGDILVFQIPPGAGAGGAAGGVVIVSTENAVTLQPGEDPGSAPIEPNLPGLGSTLVVDEIINEGATETTTETGPQTDTTITSGQTNTVSTTGQTNTTTTEDITGGFTTTVAGGTNITEDVTPDQVTITPDEVTETYGLINTIANTTYNDVNYMSGSFSASLSNSFPNQVFRGSGAVTFQTVDTSAAVPQLVSVTVPIHVNGTRTSDTEGTYIPVQVDVPRVFTEFDIQTN